MFNDYYLLCPEAMIQLVTKNLKDKGIPEDRIHFELFTSNGDQKMNFQKKLRGKTQTKGNCG